MNDMPIDWSEQLQSVYPKRSGPSGWRGMKLMLALRRALFDSTWEQIIDGCKNYAKYCKDSGSEGSPFVQAPLRFIQDGCFLEEFEFRQAEDPKVIDARNKEADRWRRAREAAAELSPALTPMPGECCAAFETRIRLAETRGNGRAHTDRGVGRGGSAGHAELLGESQGRHNGLSDRIASLNDRMRVAKL
ncbi:MAG: hypothetical protein RB191_12835 [Terriglobia bacterium]|nr:hypothetical protein [Terriglobia bacterium]